MTAPARPDRPSRRGLVSVVMLIGLIVLGIVAAGLLKVAAARWELARTAENQLQAAALADSGLDRALTRLRARPDYPGEVWEVAAADLGGRASAQITITVATDPDRPDGRRVAVVADYLTRVPGPARQSRTLVVPLPPNAR